MRGYSTTARLLHWLVALLILAMIPAGLIMTQEGIGRRLGNLLFLFHKNTGAVLILVIVLRLMWRLTHRPPPLPQSLPQWQQVAARLSHGALYGLMVVMPFSGYVRVRAGGFPVEALDALGFPTLVPRSEALAQGASLLHSVAGYGLVAVLALHVAAAMQHALVRRDGVWERMWPPFGG